jgi:hypothetical protein
MGLLLPVPNPGVSVPRLDRSARHSCEKPPRGRRLRGTSHWDCRFVVAKSAESIPGGSEWLLCPRGRPSERPARLKGSARTLGVLPARGDSEQAVRRRTPRESIPICHVRAPRSCLTTSPRGLHDAGPGRAPISRRSVEHFPLRKPPSFEFATFFPASPRRPWGRLCADSASGPSSLWSLLVLRIRRLLLRAV